VKSAFLKTLGGRRRYQEAKIRDWPTSAAKRRRPERPGSFRPMPQQRTFAAIAAMSWPQPMTVAATGGSSTASTRPHRREAQSA
jgi:hypothetical protein